MPRVAPGRQLYVEALNPYFGYFYTVKKSIKSSKTKYQEIELIDTDEFGHVLLLDDITQVATRNDFLYHEPMVHPALCAHPKPENVLVIGGGDGGILKEVVKYPAVKKIVLAELDDGVVEFSKKYLKDMHQGSFHDPRIEIQITDGRKFTEEHPKQFDVIIMDMTDPFGPSKMLYTKNFFNIVKKALRNDSGIFVMHSESPIARPQAFSCIQKTLNSVFDNVHPFYLYIQMYAILWSITVCSPKTNIGSINPTLIDKRLAKYEITDLKAYCGTTHHSMQVAFPYISQILKRGARIITDKNPDFPDDFITE